jgi:2-hydroxychromene-2-carboxylate isomerase
LALSVVQALGPSPALVRGIFAALWATPDPSRSARACLEEGLSEAGYDVGRALARADAPESMEGLRKCAAQALKAGVFDTPAFVVGDKQLFVGHDRVHFVERALRGLGRPSGPSGGTKS